MSYKHRTLYHYTSEESLNRIREERLIRHTPASNTTYACYGPGVYLTSLGPDLGRAVLINNNRPGQKWEDAAAKTTHYVSLPVGQLDKEEENVLPLHVDNCYRHHMRDIYVVRSNIDLSVRGYITGEIPQIFEHLIRPI